MAISGLRKRFGDMAVLAGIDLRVEPGEIVVLVGPSGCGKSTLLRVLAGLETDFSGEVSVGGVPVRGPSQAVGVVFQEPRLFPWLTVAENVAFGLRRGQARARVAETLAVVGLTEFATALPKQLSGGMAQRVALARALVTEPHALLLDEPFSALDAFTRMRLQDHLLAAWERYRPTLLLVTHDLDEAVYLADRVVLLGERPATVQLVRGVEVPRPRERGNLALAALRADLLQALHLDRRAA
ncbi:MAG: ABC transporter ATP-binding protein [Chloroflexota bacterium]|nr:ABC transporter ATP-binding protein [Chloroflexota bacterium]